MGYKTGDLRSNVEEWIKREEVEAGGVVLTDMYYIGNQSIEGTHGMYNAHFFMDDAGKNWGLGGSTSIDNGIKLLEDTGVIIRGEGKTKVRITYKGQLPKKGETKITSNSFKKYQIDYDNDHLKVEETPMPPKEAPEFQATEEFDI